MEPEGSHYRVHKSLPPVSILRLNQIYILQPYLPTIN
jgi:hypothetical protein